MNQLLINNALLCQQSLRYSPPSLCNFKPFLQRLIRVDIKKGKVESACEFLNLCSLCFGSGGRALGDGVLDDEFFELVAVVEHVNMNVFNSSIEVIEERSSFKHWQSLLSSVIYLLQDVSCFLQEILNKQLKPHELSQWLLPIKSSEKHFTVLNEPNRPLIRIINHFELPQLPIIAHRLLLKHIPRFQMKVRFLFSHILLQIASCRPLSR